MFLILLLLFATPLFADEVMVQVRFSEQTAYGQYQDALYYTQDDYANLKQADLDAAKEARVNNWVDSIENAPIPEEPSLESLQVYKGELENQLANVVVKIDELDPPTKEELEARQVELQQKISEIENDIEAIP